MTIQEARPEVAPTISLPQSAGIVGEGLTASEIVSANGLLSPHPIEVVDLATLEAERLHALEEAELLKTERRLKKRKRPLQGDTPETQSFSSHDEDPAIPVIFTMHANERSARRNLSEDDIRYVLDNGTEIHKTGVDFVTLRRRDIPQTQRSRDEISRLEGTTVLVTENAYITTCYRNKKALRTIRHKINERKLRNNNHLE